MTEDVLRETCSRVIGALRNITRHTGVNPEGFSIVMHPERWYAMFLGADRYWLEWDQNGVRKLRGMPVILDRDLEPGRIILRADVEA